MKQNDVVRYRGELMAQPETTKKEMVRLSFDLGLRHLWRVRLLLRYLQKEVPREDAVAAAGRAWVDFAEAHPEVFRQDMEWVLEA